MKIGVVGLGGLGHMAVKFLKAMGVHTTIISTSENKREEALKSLGAEHFLASKDEEQLKGAHETLDGIINTVSAQYDPNIYMNLLKVDGIMVILGVPPEPPSLPAAQMLFRRKAISGSLIGGIYQTQEMLDFCAEKGIVCATEVVNADYVAKAYDRVVKADVKYRFVIDIQGSLIQ
jgi:cinnamyl-alcohol dehydrogenase